MVELAGAPRPNSGAGHRVGDQKESADFLLHVIKNAESIAEPKGLEADSLVTEQIQRTKHPRCAYELMAQLTGT